MTANEVSTDKLVTDLKRVVRDSEELLKDSAGAMGDKAGVPLKISTRFNSFQFAGRMLAETGSRTRIVLPFHSACMASA